MEDIFQESGATAAAQTPTGFNSIPLAGFESTTDISPVDHNAISLFGILKRITRLGLFFAYFSH
jgi:hypothetical protein